MGASTEPRTERAQGQCSYPRPRVLFHGWDVMRTRVCWGWGPPVSKHYKCVVLLTWASLKVEPDPKSPHSLLPLSLRAWARAGGPGDAAVPPLTSSPPPLVVRMRVRAEPCECLLRGRISHHHVAKVDTRFPWCFCASLFFLFYLRLYLFIFRERGKEGGREGEKY